MLWKKILPAQYGVCSLRRMGRLTIRRRKSARAAGGETGA